MNILRNGYDYITTVPKGYDEIRFCGDTLSSDIIAISKDKPPLQFLYEENRWEELEVKDYSHLRIKQQP